jgi:hypothetical protein
LDGVRGQHGLAARAAHRNRQVNRRR